MKPARLGIGATSGGYSLHYVLVDLRFLMKIDGKLFGVNGNVGGEKGMNYVTTGKVSMGLSATRGSWPTLGLDIIRLIATYTLVDCVDLAET